jgi:acetylornithine deacetylase
VSARETSSDVVELLTELVAIDSTNPALSPDGAGEREIAAFVAAWLNDRGVGAERSPTGAHLRPNVLARIEGRRRGPTLLLNAHLDTVGVDGMEHPFAPTVIGDRLYGRGSLDTKGGLAAAMVAIVELSHDPPPGAVVLAAVADEEHASIGTEALLGRIEAAGAIVYEPTDLSVLVSHKGFMWVDIEVTGVAAHGSRPDIGVDANVGAALVVTRLMALSDVLARHAHPLLRPQSLHVGRLAGGQERSSYARSCIASIEVRTHPSTHPAEIMELIEAQLDRVRAEQPRLTIRSDLVMSRPGLDGDATSPVATALASAVSEVLRTPATIGGHDGWMDAALLARAGIPSVVFGPAGEGLHGLDEWVDLPSVDACRRATVLAARRFAPSGS